MIQTLTSWDGRAILANALPDLTIELDASELALGASIPELCLQLQHPLPATLHTNSSNWRELYTCWW